MAEITRRRDLTFYHANASTPSCTTERLAPPQNIPGLTQIYEKTNHVREASPLGRRTQRTQSQEGFREFLRKSYIQDLIA
jgi:predicted phage gp36 major capsid-like protein